jgi:uncharacterized protein (TIGR02453 family)
MSGPTVAPFAGFPPDALTFLAELKANNDRAWFAANGDTHERAVRAPAEAFVAAVTPKIEALIASPVAAKIFRIHRDVRFARDKSPFNAHLHISFTPTPCSAGDRSSATGFFFGLEPDRLHLGAGAFEFSGGALDRYRAAVADEITGRNLADIVVELSRRGFRLDEPILKRVPTPYPADHPNADLLRRKGLTAWRELPDRTEIASPRLLDAVISTFQILAPLNRWISETIAERVD